MKKLDSKTSPTAARVAIAAIIGYNALMFLTIYLRPDIDARWHTVSEYAIGSWGWVMSLAFIAGGIGYAALFFAIKSQVRGVTGKVGLAIFAICVIGLIGVGIFTTDNMDVTPLPDCLTTTGLFHVIFGMSQFLLLPFAALLINLSLFLKNKAWGAAWLPLLLTGVLPLFALIAFIAHLAIYVIPLGENAHGEGVYVGWPPRYLFLSYMVWVITIAWVAILVRKSKRVW
jgi:hypothetical protein